MYRFFHDLESNAVYSCRAEPDVIQRMHRGKLIGWQIRLVIDITRADNWLDSSNHWHFPAADHRVQEFDHPYSREQAVSWFLLRHSPEAIYPNAVQIDEATFRVLSTEYDDAARSNGPRGKIDQ